MYISVPSVNVLNMFALLSSSTVDNSDSVYDYDFEYKLGFFHLKASDVKVDTLNVILTYMDSLFSCYLAVNLSFIWTTVVIKSQMPTVLVCLLTVLLTVKVFSLCEHAYWLVCTCWYKILHKCLLTVLLKFPCLVHICIAMLVIGHLFP